MALVAKHAAHPSLGYRIRLEFKTDDGYWCDMNRAFPKAHDDPGVNRLLQPSQLTIRTEHKGRAFSTSGFSLVLRNDDGIFDQTTDFILYDNDGFQHTLPSWHRARVKLTLENLTDSGWTTQILGVFMVDGLTTSARTRTASLRLVGLQKLLVDASAETVREADRWWENVPVSVLIDRLVRKGMGPTTEYADPWPPPLFVDGPIPGDLRFNHAGRANTQIWGAPEWAIDMEFVPTCVLQDPDDSDLLWVGGGSISTVDRWRARFYAYHKARGEWTRAAFNPDGVVGWFGKRGGYVWVLTVQNKNPDGNYLIFNHKAQLWRYDPATGTAALSASLGLWTCTDSYRLIEVAAGIGQLGGFGNYKGENVVHPVWQQAQRWRVSGSPANWGYANTTKSFSQRHDVIADSAGHNTTNVEQGPGWRPFVQTDTDDNVLRTCLWPYAKVGEQQGQYLYFIAYISGSDYWRLYKVDLDASGPGSFSSSSVTINFTGVPSRYDWYNKMFTRQITAWTLNDADDLFIGVMEWKDDTASPTYAAGISRSAIYKMRTSTGAQINLQKEWTGEDEMFTVTWLRADFALAGLSWVIGAVFDRKTSRYGVLIHRENGTPTYAFTHPDIPLPVSGAPLAGWCYKSPYHYCIDSGNGQVWRIGISSEDAIALAGGMPAHEAETHSAVSEMAVDSDARLYGISAPYAPFYPYPWYDFVEPPHSGAMSLWELSDRRSLVVEIADFEDMTCWNAIRDLAEFAGDYDVGVDEDGKFVFRPRSGAASLTMVLAGEERADPQSSVIAVDDLEKSIEYEEIINVVDITPWRAELAPPPPPSFEPVPASTMTRSLSAQLQQRDRGRKHVILRCSRAGAIGISTDSTEYAGDEDAADGTDSRLLMSWIYGVDEIFHELHVDMPGTVTVLDPSTPPTYEIRQGPYGQQAYLGPTELHVGDLVRVGDGPVRKITSLSGIFIFLDGPISDTEDTVPAGTRIQFTPRKAEFAVDSEDGIATLEEDLAGTGGSNITVEVDTLKEIRKDMILRIDAEEFRVTATDRKASPPTFTAARAILGTVKAAHTAGAKIQGYISPVAQGRLYEIGGTGLAIGFQVDENLSAEERTFAVSDRIVIESEGARARKSRQGTVIVDRISSVRRYGRKVSRRDKNRFLSPAAAKGVAFALLDTWAEPYVTIAGSTPGLPSFGIGDVVALRSARVLPDEASNTMSFTITEIGLDFIGGRTRFRARSLAAAQVGGAAAAPGGGEEVGT